MTSKTIFETVIWVNDSRVCAQGTTAKESRSIAISKAEKQFGDSLIDYCIELRTRRLV